MKIVNSNMQYPLVALLVAIATASSPANAQDCEVKLGAVGPMTGGAANWGLALKAAVEFTAAMANQDGGLTMGSRKCRVKVFPVDALYTASGGAAAANLLASQNVQIILGPMGSPETVGLRPVAKRHGQLSFNPSYMEGAISPEFPLGFHATQAPRTWGPELIKAAKVQFKFNTAMIVAPNDQAGTDPGKQLAKMYGDLGVKTTEEYYQRGTTNFAPMVTRIMNANPDTLEMSGVPPGEAINLTKQLMEAGFKGFIGCLGATGAAPILQGAGGPEKLKGFYWLEMSPVDHPGILKMKADYGRVMKTPAPPDPVFAVYVLAAEVTLTAISRAGTDQDAEKVADALRKFTPESRYMGKAGWRGKTQYGINQELTFPAGLGMVVDGIKLPVRTIEIAAE